MVAIRTRVEACPDGRRPAVEDGSAEAVEALLRRAVSTTALRADAEVVRHRTAASRVSRSSSRHHLPGLDPIARVDMEALDDAAHLGPHLNEMFRLDRPSGDDDALDGAAGHRGGLSYLRRPVAPPPHQYGHGNARHDDKADENCPLHGDRRNARSNPTRSKRDLPPVIRLDGVHEIQIGIDVPCWHLAAFKGALRALVPVVGLE
jgi:hypothetical protein